APDHANRGEAEPVIVLTHEAHVIRLMRAGNQPDGCQVAPLQYRAVNPFRARDIGVDDERNHTTRPSITVLRGGVRRLNLIKGEQQECKCRKCGSKDTSHPWGPGECEVAHSQIFGSGTIYRNLERLCSSTGFFRASLRCSL